MRDHRLLLRLAAITAAAISFSYVGSTSALAQEGTRRASIEAPPPFSPTQTPPPGQPAFVAIGLQLRWDYSDLVCTGTAHHPQRTGVVKRIGDADRDQLRASVTIETCFKGKTTRNPIHVIGYDLYAQKETKQGFIYAGPPTGFVTQGRNLLFLRRTNAPGIWDVTVPVYETCLALAPTAPAYTTDGSPKATRRALAAEVEAVATANPEKSSYYLGYVLDFLGEQKGLAELKPLSPTANEDLRRQIALLLLRHHDQDGEGEAIALLEDSSEADWQRANAARALRNATSIRAKRALEWAATEPEPDELRKAAQESISYMERQQ